MSPSPRERTPDELTTGLSPAAQALYDFVDAIAQKVEKGDELVRDVRVRVEKELADEQLQVPRMPHVAARILECFQGRDVSTRDVLDSIRQDPALAGRLIERANSAAFAGSQAVFSLQGSMVRLGMTSVSATVHEMTESMRPSDKRTDMQRRLWKFSLATAHACEVLAGRVPGEKDESGYLTGLMHAVAAPVIVDTLGRIERERSMPLISDSRVLGLLDELTVPLTEKIVRRWSLPKPAQEAIRLQHAKVRERRGRVLAHVLVCGKCIATELGLGVRPEPIDFERDRDFKFLNLMSREKIDPILDGVRARMGEVEEA